MLRVIMVSVIMLNVGNNPFMLSVVMLNVMMLSIVALNLLWQSLRSHCLKYFNMHACTHTLTTTLLAQ
jgi:hypothetical protein